MIRPRASKAIILCGVLWTWQLCAADFSSYRGFRFGADVTTIAKQAGMRPLEARLVHQRPAVIEELVWRPGYPYRAGAMKTDPVEEGLLRFYNGQLFRIVVTYDYRKVEGMTEADMVEAISLTYGPATKPAVEIAYHSNYGEVASVIARWEDPQYAYNLIRTGDRSSFAMVLCSKRLEALARAAIVEAVRLDTLEAPQRAIDLAKKQEAERLLMLNEARAENQPNFRP